nr:MAG TPA: hypothetical protein [Caudoviricetes sp.]
MTFSLIEGHIYFHIKLYMECYEVYVNVLIIPPFNRCLTI